MKHPNVAIGGKVLREEECGLLVVALGRVINDKSTEEPIRDGAVALLQKLINQS